MLTFAGLKAYLNMFRFPVVSTVMSAVVLSNLCEALSSDFRVGILFVVILALGYVAGVGWAAAIYTWKDNDWRLSWSATRGVILLFGFFTIVGAVTWVRVACE